ncbi:uncharacterized protein FOMMEDRAFT_104743 [Fomitiporia mediterranea MF3/22]|uniref:uncharacterized protein n=1 Tax=Fomitiporia mediterranea (strain MF3/22) TaxID=694068 RepID=UPI0004407B13|nr:uncharacterized protein FOMMEDRAFT_104743 [Fomitiporia mediterranea MF3/22]EJD06229.1 hypothetical protein FOMMEDRAFT_104743 [Fomitiporia mediterranea MF3/22]
MSKPKASSKYPVVMTIAGTDPSGGAGIQADLKTFTALQCYGTSVATALTAQNTTGVQGVFPVPPDFIEKQLTSVLTDTGVAAFKTGMLYDAANARAVARCLRELYKEKPVPPLVIDPVCVSTSGHTLLEAEAVAVLAKELFPLATLVTPNKAEAELLLKELSTDEQKAISSIDDALDAASSLAKLGSCDVLLKGGHFTVMAGDISSFVASHETDNRVRVIWEGIDENMEILQTKPVNADASLVIDILYEREGNVTTVFARPRIDSTSTHGTGCTLSSAIACYLARGNSVMEAVRLASEYTHAGIKTAFSFGKGNGPLNHMHAFLPRVVPPPTKEDPYPFTRALIRSNASVWKQYVEHPFVKQLGEGTLRRESFLHFVKQDYQYLKYYARAYGLLVAKSRRFADIKPATDTIVNVLNEVTMHKSYCAAELGITEIELESTPESPATTAYGAFLLDSGLRGDETHLIVTLAACLLGYGEVGLWLKSQAQKPNPWVKWEGNPYLRWIEDYSGVRYQNAVRSGLDILELAAREDPPSPKRFEQWREVWGKCTMLEKQFWDMAMELS